MAGNSDNYHEPYELLSSETRDWHRGVVSVMEELEAIDWYQQRAEACGDEELRSILLHNRDEEIEHAMMGLEWLRRQSPKVDEMARTYLFTEGPIVGREKAATAGEATDRASAAPAVGCLGIGSLRGTT